jgi:dipeptidyl aminopeptidase/acylaminoacyl peptidase
MAPRPFVRLAVVLALLACGSTPLQAAPASAALPPIERFFINPVLADAKLSPDARYLAAISGAPGRRDYLVVIDLQQKTPKLVAGYQDADIRQFDWVNNERLVFDLADKQEGDTRAAAGLFAVDRDGGKPLQLASRRGGPPGMGVNRRMLPWHTFMLGGRGAQDSEFIYVTSNEYADEHFSVIENVNLLRLDTRTGRSQVVQRPGKVGRWMLDQHGEPRLAMGSEKGVSTLHYRDPATDQWRVLTTFATYKGGRNAFTPLGFGRDGTLYATAYGEGDTTGLVTIDLATGKPNPKAIVVAPGYDFMGALVRSGDKVLGVRISTDAETTVWFDPAIKAAQEKLDAALPGLVNQISFPSGDQSQWTLVKSYSDVQPLAYYVYNIAADKLEKVGDAYPGIDPARMGRQDPVRYKARDGMEIPALLTQPAGGARNAPLVVLVHGGPYVHGNHWGWNGQTQFLASRGYAVLEPDYRGSTGYGVKHFRAGWKQWGLAMQNDIADGARWAIAQGYADPKRICIAGASYGGYAVLMGLANDPDLYKCGVSWVGVTDINLLYDGHWSFASDLQEQWKIYGMPDMIGDQVKDAAQLKATSPIEQAARIKAPLILAYGARDRRVPMYHGRKFLSAVKPHNTQVEWIEYEDEGHGWRLPKNQVDFWGRVEKFLDKNIGPAAAK